MKNRYRLFKRGNVFYAHDAETNKQESLQTRDRKEAQRILIAKNESQDNRLLNVKIAEAHLAAHDPQMSKRTWQDVMDHMTSRDGEVRESTLDRTKVAFASKPFDIIRDKRLIDTVSADFLRLLKEGGVSANVWLRVLHNTALKLDWLVRRVLAQAVCSGRAKTLMNRRRTKWNISSAVRRHNTPAQQITARWHRHHPACDKQRKADIRLCLKAFQPVSLDQFVTKLAETESELVVAETRSRNPTE